MLVDGVLDVGCVVGKITAQSVHLRERVDNTAENIRAQSACPSKQQGAALLHYCGYAQFRAYTRTALPSVTREVHAEMLDEVKLNALLCVFGKDAVGDVSNLDELRELALRIPVHLEGMRYDDITVIQCYRDVSCQCFSFRGLH